MADISLLNIFEPKVRNNIIAFCKELNETKANLYIVMARKAACFISVLEELSLISLRGEVISERVLDTRIDWSNYKKVIIIDDVVISGTTLYHTINLIRQSRPDADISLFVLGVNSDWFNPRVLEEDGTSYIQQPIRRMNNSECIRLSGDIVRMLSKYPLPYNIDFPIYNTLRLNKSEFRQLITLPGWHVSEVSSFSNSNPNTFTHTFQPDNEILEYLGTFFRSEFMSHALLKVRTYGRRRTDKQHEYNLLTVVPMVIMPPVSEADLQNIFKSISGTKYDILNEILFTPTSKLRFVQYVVSDALARLFIRMSNHIFCEETQVHRDYKSLRYLFPMYIIGEINEVADNFLGNCDIDLGGIPDTNNVAKASVKDFLDINHSLTAPFVNMYYQQEIPSRRLVRQYGKEVFSCDEYKNAIDRLNRGVSLTYLLHILSDIPLSIRVSFISAFLDRAIDEGIVVPITVFEGNYVYRAFRHGEDVQFGQQEERLCYDMLSAFVASTKREELPRLWVEKMLVLLFQLGEGHIFVPMQTNLSSFSNIEGYKKVDSAGVRFYLQGPLVVKTPTEDIMNRPYLEYNDKALWMSSYFSSSSQSPLQDSDSRKYIFNQQRYSDVSQGDNQIVVDSKKTQFAKNVGRLFGVLLANDAEKTTPSVNSDDLVALTSSLETRSVIGAMAAEINICTNSFRSDSAVGVRITLDGIMNGTIPSEQGFERIRKSAWYQAVNDGIRKFTWYREKKGYEIINTISSQFQDELYKDTWDGLWSPNMENWGNLEKAEVIEQANIEGQWLCCVNAYFLMLNYLKMKEADASFSSKELLEKIDSLYQVVKTYAPQARVKEIIPIILGFINKHHDPKYVKSQLPVIYSRLISLFNRSDKILGDAKTYFSNYLRLPKYQNYHHVLYIELPDGYGDRILKHFYETFRYKMQNCGREINTEVLQIPPDDSIFPNPYHRVLISYNDEGLGWLIEAASDFIQKIRGVSDAKLFLFPHLPAECHIKVSQNGMFQYQLFNNFMLNMLDIVQSASYGSNCLYELSETVVGKNIVQENPFFARYAIAYSESREIYVPNKREYNLTKYEETNMELVKKADIGIITIVNEEAQAVRKGFGMPDDGAVIRNKRYYDEAVFEVSGKEFFVVHTQCPIQGNVSMAIAVLEFIKLYNPSRMILLGIAGSIQDKINICDVVIASDILYYESRKEDSDGKIEHRLRNFNMSFDMLSHIQHYSSITHDDFRSSDDSPERTFKLHVTPIGTGEAVIGNKLSDTRKWLLSVHSKTGAVETEAAGFSAAFNESTSGVNDILIIRGISDKADVDKDDKWRLAASENAVTVLKDFIAKIFSRI